jgi:hypothetical protein
MLQTHLGHLYDPERDWTSEHRYRSGYKPFTNIRSHAAFTLGGPEVAKQMLSFVTSLGRSSAPDWKAFLQDHALVYHLDVVVNSGSKMSPFVLTTWQTERVSTM